MNTLEIIERIKLEEKLVKENLPNFKMYAKNGLFFFSGWVEAKLGRYKLRLVLPYEAPRLFLVSPRVLYTYEGRSIDSFSVSRRFHTEGNGPGGCIQISYTSEWDASCTCAAALIKGIVWINEYEEGHLSTGKTIE